MTLLCRPPVRVPTALRGSAGLSNGGVASSTNPHEEHEYGRGRAQRQCQATRKQLPALTQISAPALRTYQEAAGHALVLATGP